MAKTDKSTEKPETTKTQKATKTPKSEVVQPLKVEITFPSIADLKQALAFDADGNLLIKVQFTSRVDQYEIFRLVNLLKQPHGTLYATIGTPQSAMDFKFDHKAGKVEIIQAAKALAQGKKTGKPAAAQEPTDHEGTVVKIHGVTFNHMEEESKPYGVCIDYVVNGTGEIKTVAGRGMNPTEAVLAGIAATKILPADLKEPFEVMAALELLDPSPDCYKLIHAIEVGSFDEEPGKEGEQPAKGE